ncbi:MAG: 3-dehydroquinate synthase [Planctomycetes bacterium]|nr:3-dehydroquinate synthase [Planctomycetota bacterium]
MNLDAEFSVRFVHRLRFGQNLFDPDHSILIDLLGSMNSRPVQAAVFLDKGLADAQPDLENRINQFARTHHSILNLGQPVQVLSAGEPLKNNSRNLEQILRTIDSAGLCRHSYVIAVGGGALLDVIGFAAAMAHRGIRHIRVATTTLSQADSAMGIKNGINAFGKKNYLGTFTVPWAVINDEAMLGSLPDAHWISGFSETVKVALLKDADLFRFIAQHAARIRNREMSIAIDVIRRSALLHFDHITGSGDPFELSQARPLDFGHWAAHKLEQLTHFELLHGHGVALGMALDVTYAKLKGYLSQTLQQDILKCLSDLGFSLYHPAMDNHDGLLAGLDDFREHLGGTLNIPMIRDVADPFDVQSIDHKTMIAAIDELKHNALPA